MNQIYAGMDPGSKGFITLWDGSEYRFIKMPTHRIEKTKATKTKKAKMSTEFHEGGLRDIVFQIKKMFPNSSFKVGIEDVGGRGGWSATNNFNFGYKAGLQRMIWIMLGAEIEVIRPQKWQAVMSKGYEQVKKDSKSGKTQVKDPKAMAELIVSNEWPDIDFRKSTRSKENDDNKIDSFLICNYMMRKDKK